MVELVMLNGDILVILKLKYGCDLIRYNEVCREFCKLVEIIF